MVAAGHNPIDYNGMKLAREDARPISGDIRCVSWKQPLRHRICSPRVKRR